MPHFELTKTGSLIQRPADMPGPGPYYTTLVPMRAVKGFPFEYALYFSTDHHAGDGGIWLYVCDGPPTDAASWMSYDEAVKRGRFDHLAHKPARNPIFHDTVQGDGHTETPHANVIDGRAYLTYHKNNLGPTQATLLATATDGVNFTRIHGEDDSVILSYDPAKSVGDGHTGYFRWAANPFAGITQRYVGYSLHGGTNVSSYSAIWGSHDAEHWEILDVLDRPLGLGVEEHDRCIIWHEIDPASVRALGSGEYTAICGVGTPAAGAATRVTELYEIYLADDGRTLTRRSRKLLACGGSGCDDAEELTAPTCVQINNTLHLLYVGAKDGGKVNTIMGASGHFAADSPRALPLPAEEQRRHIHQA